MSPLLDVALKSTALLLVVAGIATVLRSASAATRHLIWSLGLTGLLLLPALSAAIPWRFAVLPTDIAPAPARNAGVFERTRDPVEVRSGPLPASPAIVAPTVAPPQVSGGAASAAPDPAPAPRSGAPLTTIWLVGVLVVLGRLGLGVFAARHLARRAEPLTDPVWQAALDAAAGRVQVHRTVRLVRSDAAALPMTAGVFRPTIILPPDSVDWSAERRQAVLLHELAHVRRSDVLMHLVAQASCAFYWFHPLAWVAARRQRAESERASDDVVLTAGTRASDYAGHLLELVRTAGRVRAPAAALPMAQRSDFEGRLLAILEPRARRHQPNRTTVTLAACAILLTAIPVAAIGPAQATETATLVAPPLTAEPAIDPGAQAGPAVEASRTQDRARLAAPGSAPAASVEPERDKGAPDPVAPQTASVVQALITALQDPMVAVRRNAAAALGQRADSDAVVALSRALRSDADAGVRKAAAQALGEIDDPRAIPALLDALRQDRDAEVRATAAWALGEIEDPSAIDGLATALRDVDLEVRKAVAAALGDIDNPRAAPHLTPLLRDTSAEVRQAAAEALGSIESPVAVDPLVSALRDRDAAVRAAAAEALGNIEDARAASALAAVLRDSSVAVRRAAAQAIGDLDELSRAPQGLIDALKDTDAEVRHEAAHALGNLKDPAAVPGLAALVHDPYRDVREAAIEALGEIGGTAASEALVAALRDPDPEIRRLAAKALGENR